MDIIQVFKEAALKLQEDERYIALANIRKKNDSDNDLDQLTKDFSESKERLSQELEKEIRDNDLVVELNAKTNRLYGEIMSYPGIIEYNKAKLEVDKLVAYIDAIITGALSGLDPMNIQEPQQKKGEPCTSDCSECGGCH